MKLSALVAAVSSIVFLAACGSPEGSSLLDTGSGSSTGDIMASSPADATGSSTGNGSTATTDPGATATPDVAATTPAPGGGRPVPTGTSFVDPEGKYTMTVYPKWKTAQALTKGAEAWIVGPAEGTVPTSLSVLTEDFNGPAIGITLKQYLQISVQNTTKQGFKVLKVNSIAGFNSARLGVLEYAGAPDGQPFRHFLAIVDLNRTGAAVATLITGQKTFTKNRGNALPYMLTIKAN